MDKRPHNLHTASTLGELSAILEQEYEINILEETKAIFEEMGNPGIIVTGSLIDGNANSSSDLDIKVLTNTPYVLKDNIRNSLILGFDTWKEVNVFKNGILLSVTIHEREEMERIFRAMQAIAPALSNPEDVKVFSVFGDEELLFMHHLRDGWVVEGEDTVQEWRNLCLVDLLHMHASLKHFLDSLSFYEDALSVLVLANVKHASTHVGAISARHGVLSLLALEGFTNPNHKWIINNMARTTNPEVKSLLDKGLALMYPAIKNQNEADFIEKIEDFLSGVKGVLEANEIVKNVLDIFLSKITFLNKESF
jgi:predicted nucleotidyltransferase